MRFSLLGAILTMVLAAIAADRIFAQPKPQRSPKELIAERDRLAKQSQTLIRAGKTDDAIPLMERKLKLERELLVRVIGVLPNRKDLHAHFCELLLNTLTFLADQHRQSGNLTSALKLRQEIVHHQETVYGKSDWRVTDARLAVNNLTELVQLTAQQRNELEYANKLHHRGVQLYHEGKSASAIPIIQQSLQIRTKILGPKHIDTSTSMNILGTLYSSMGDYAKAELPYQESLEISRKVLGPEHPVTASSLNNLGNLYSSMGDDA
ncbi:MAG: tetratricopeptide repeat protein [Planctomycetes bacterium]|nr:tetratricopeptide repeat protein [Planctomycetota bacterium]